MFFSFYLLLYLFSFAVYRYKANAEQQRSQCLHYKNANIPNIISPIKKPRKPIIMGKMPITLFLLYHNLYKLSNINWFCMSILRALQALARFICIPLTLQCVSGKRAHFLYRGDGLLYNI